MSRIGKTPIHVIAGSTITLESDKKTVVVKGPKGELRFILPEGIEMTTEGSTIHLLDKTTSGKKGHALHGLARATIASLMTGVTTGWSKNLELVGVGYRAAISGADLTLAVGFSHPVTVTPPAGISFAITDGKIVVSGADKQLVGEVAAKIRAIKKPEPYKGKGIKYQGEVIRKKAGKSAKAVGGAPGGK